MRSPRFSTGAVPRRTSARRSRPPSIRCKRHKEIGSGWLAARFPAAVSEPVRLHVPAKRYLCATRARYLSKLSSAFVATLKLQGGPISAAEIARFEKERYSKEAVRIRYWDDRGKIAGLVTLALVSYRELPERVATGAIVARHRQAAG